MNAEYEASTSKSEATRARIKNAIVGLVSIKPASDITISDVCTAAKLTHGGFYFHFRNKDQALIEIAEEWLRDMKLAVLEVPDNDLFLAEIHQMLSTYVAGYTRNIELTRVVYGLDPQKTGIRSVYNYYHDRWLVRLEQRFSRARPNQAEGPEMGRVLAHGLTAALEGLCVRTFLLGVPELVHFARKPSSLVADLTVLWFRAVMGAEPPAEDLLKLMPD